MPYVENWEEVVHGFRSDLCKLSKKITPHKSVLTAQDISDVAAEESPGNFVSFDITSGHNIGEGVPGGRLFELFIDLFSTRTTFDRLTRQRLENGPTPEQWTAHFVQHRQSFSNLLELAISISSMAFN